MDFEHSLDRSVDFFHRYVDDVVRLCQTGSGAVELKRGHSIRVLSEAKKLTRALQLGPNTSFLIHLSALFHDLGRFAQILQYNTFNDRQSFNHARESVRVLKRLDLLASIETGERRLVMGAIYLHNHRTLPGYLKPELSLIARVLRDADKIDIVSVILSYLEGEKEPDTSVYLHLVRDPQRYSPELLGWIHERRVYRLSAATYVNDFLLLMCSWMYDLSCHAAKMAFRERGYIDRIFKHLPKNEELVAVKKQLDHDLSASLADSRIGAKRKDTTTT